MLDFTSIYNQYYRQIYRYVYGRLLNSEAAEDVASDVFFAAWKNLESYDQKRGTLSAWLFAIAHNITENYRHKAHFRHEVSVWGIPENKALASEQTEEGSLKNPANARAYKILQKLTDDERELLFLRCELNMTHEEIGARIGASAATVRQRYSRLLAKCRLIDKG